MIKSEIDYALTGLTIREAMLDHRQRNPPREQRPIRLRWGKHYVQTSDCWAVPKGGVLRMEILSARPEPRQGFDIKMSGGILLADGRRIPVLRTWHDKDLDPVVEYSYFASDGLLWTWNVYESMRGKNIVVERWTENAGMIIEQVSGSARLYRCSQGFCGPAPDFADLTYKLTVCPRDV